jgi:hypothetical protein
MAIEISEPHTLAVVDVGLPELFYIATQYISTRVVVDIVCSFFCLRLQRHHIRFALFKYTDLSPPASQPFV